MNMDIDMDIVKTEIITEDETPKVSSMHWFHDYSFNKELKIILERCDQKQFNPKFLNSFTIKKELEFQCPLGSCPRTFSTERQMRRHHNEVHVLAPIKYPHKNCEKYLKPTCMKSHVQSVHQEVRVPCTVNGCNQSFATKSGLWYHLKRIHNKIRSSCDNCGKQVSYLRHHLKRCLRDTETKFFCSFEDCKAVFYVQYDLTRHEKFKHRNFRYECKHCGKRVSTLNNHLERCLSDGVKKFFCTVERCKTAFATRINLRNHMITHQDPIKCPREECKFFTKPYLMPRHIKFAHDLSEKFRCENCGKRFAELRHHVVYCKSDGVRKFFCTIGNCEAKFISKIRLQSHLRATHAAPVKCPHKGCDTMVKPAGLVSHLRFKHEDIAKQCDNCGKFLKRLKRHQRTCQG